MKKILPLVLVGAFCFVAGLLFNLSGQAQRVAPSNQNIPVASNNPVPTPCPETEFTNLINEDYITKSNGTRLNLDYTSGVQSVDIPYAVDAAEVMALGDGGLLVNFGDTLYRLDNRFRVRWKYHTAQLILDYALVESTSLIYGTAGDNVMFVLDATTGKEQTSQSRNGSAAYGATERFGANMCLVTDNFVMYREKFRPSKIDPMKDGITCWQGTRVLWHLDFPPDADLVVNGQKILAVTKSREAIYVKQISPPQTKSE